MSSFPVRQEEDRLSGRRLVQIFAATLVLFGVSLGIAAMLLRTAEPASARAASVPSYAPAQIGTVEQTLILDTERGLSLRREQQRRLKDWGWIDRDAGVARIPVDVAMQLVIEKDGSP